MEIINIVSCLTGTFYNVHDWIVEPAALQGNNIITNMTANEKEDKK